MLDGYKRVKLPKKIRTPEKFESVKQAVIKSPCRSARKQALALEVSKTTIIKNLYKDLGFYPYKKRFLTICYVTIYFVSKLFRGC